MRITRRNFHHEYEELESYEAGVSLMGGEVKQIRAGHAQLEGAYVKFIGNSPCLINALIPPYPYASMLDYDPRRTRQLLLTQREITKLQTKLSAHKGMTIAPKSWYTKGRLIKMEIALVKGLGDVEKKKLVKARDLKLEQKKMMKEYMKS